MGEIQVRSEIYGSVSKIEVKVGDRVAREAPLLIVESMKMEISLLARGGRRSQRAIQRLSLGDLFESHRYVRFRRGCP
jgi:acetyl/propionyl-CoA carboxylase alpha subunit